MVKRILFVCLLFFVVVFVLFCFVLVNNFGVLPGKFEDIFVTRVSIGECDSEGGGGTCISGWISSS